MCKSVVLAWKCFLHAPAVGGFHRASFAHACRKACSQSESAERLTVMRPSGCRAGDVASHPSSETCVGLDSANSFLSLQAGTYSGFTRLEGERHFRGSERRPPHPFIQEQIKTREQQRSSSDGISRPHQSHMAADPLLWRQTWRQGRGHDTHHSFSAVRRETSERGWNPDALKQLFVQRGVKQPEKKKSRKQGNVVVALRLC